MDLQKYCSEDERRINIRTPFTRGEFTYATNGHILVRVPRQEDAPERDDAPHAERVYDPPAANAGEYLPISFPRLPKWECEKDECPSCDGRGTDHDCPDCQCKCDDCSGNGEVVIEPKDYVAIDGISFSLKYALMLAELSNLRIGVARPNEPLAFQFDGGAGILMPVKGVQEHVAEAKSR